MYKPIIKRFGSNNNNQFVDCIIQAVNPSVCLQMLEAVFSYVKSPDRTSDQSEVTVEVYFVFPDPFVRILRDKVTFRRSLCEDVLPLLLYNEKNIIPNPLGLQCKVDSLLPDEYVDLVIFYDERTESTIDELSQRYL
ncbi:hypothetical protein [Floridanema aerugineum]|uniref:Uncharacterized protein n=1 Tax=Floridaenema aerugineum BLCC-F46 TaxID=3153654 RepID=A0ABV4X7C5_9CYAN